MSAMQRLFQLMAEKKASDIYLSVNSPINIRINGVAVPINQQVMTADTIRALLYEIMTESQKKEFENTRELNTAYELQDVGAYRLSAFYQRGSPAAVIRYIPGTIPALGSLGLPNVLGDIIMEKRGLILMVGATGTGKSTSLASMMDYRNELKSGHILTIEDPVEFMFKNKKSIVNQREVGRDTLDFKIALKNALRQAPDVILIGEVRDQETMTAAIQYAQTGHLCLATLHANNSYYALNRVISFYPLENRPALLQDLAASLKAVVSQRLVKNKKGTRTPAVEVMLNTRYISELIEKGAVNEIKEAMEKSTAPGTQTFEQALFKLFADGTITQEEALINADSPTNLLWLINNSEHGASLSASTPLEMPKKAAAQEEAAPSKDGSASFDGFTLMTDDKS
jgi:twitching motility protein PilU